MNQNVTVSPDTDGRPVVLVPVAGSVRPARLYPDDFERLKAQGLTTGWYLLTAKAGKHYVRVGRKRWRGKQETVARLIIGAGPRDVVRYRDGDPLNLRRDNLEIHRKHQRRDEHVMR